MKVSVIIPTYGEPVFLKNAINSVINQSYRDWELIIVDDNNPDSDARERTEKLVSSFLEIDHRIRYIKHPKNLNGANARNSGLLYATGEYISFLDSDDEYLPQRLEKCCQLLDKSSADFAGVYTGCEFRKKGKKYCVYENVKSGNFLIETLACRFMFCTGSNLFIRKGIINELNGFDGSFLRHQDYEFLVRVFEKYKLLAIQEVLVIKNNENFNAPNSEKLIQIKKHYLNKYKKIIDSLDDKYNRYIYQSNYIAVAEAALCDKKYRLSNIYYSKARLYGDLGYRDQARRIGLFLKNVLNI